MRQLGLIFRIIEPLKSLISQFAESCITIDSMQLSLSE